VEEEVLLVHQDNEGKLVDMDVLRNGGIYSGQTLCGHAMEATEHVVAAVGILAVEAVV
jgi:hypothetical protein